MGFKDWLIFHASTAGLVIAALFVAMFGLAAVVAEMMGIAIVLFIAAGLLVLYARYRYREYDIHTQQRKYGMR